MPVRTTRREFLAGGLGAAIGAGRGAAMAGTDGSAAAPRRRVGDVAYAFDRSEFKPQAEVDQLSHEGHVRLEQERIARCIAHLNEMLGQRMPKGMS